MDSEGRDKGEFGCREGRNGCGGDGGGVSFV